MLVLGQRLPTYEKHIFSTLDIEGNGLPVNCTRAHELLGLKLSIAIYNLALNDLKNIC